MLAIQFADLLEALAATPVILGHRPSAVEVMDRSFILDHTRQNAALERDPEEFIQGDPGALLCVEFYDETNDRAAAATGCAGGGLDATEAGLSLPSAPGLGRTGKGLESARSGAGTVDGDEGRCQIDSHSSRTPRWRRRGFGDYIERFLEIIRQHETSAGIYAHASVGCLHVRPVVNMKTAEGDSRSSRRSPNEVSDLVLEFGGALSGEHGDGLVRSPFMRKMFGPTLYEAFRTIKRTFDPEGIFNPGKIVDAPPLTSNLRFGAGVQDAQSGDVLRLLGLRRHGRRGGDVQRTGRVP